MGVWSSVPTLKQAANKHWVMCRPSASVGSKAALKISLLTQEFKG